MTEKVSLWRFFVALAVIWVAALTLPRKWGAALPVLVILGYGATTQGSATIAKLLDFLQAEGRSLGVLPKQDDTPLGVLPPMAMPPPGGNNGRYRTLPNL